MRLIDELNELHDYYAAKINEAVAHDDLASADQLARAYETDAVRAQSWRDHRRLLDALLARDPDKAAWSAAAHMHNVYNSTIGEADFGLSPWEEKK